MTATLTAQIADAELEVKRAASLGYSAYKAATDRLAGLQAALAATMPERQIVVTGNTYRHRKALASLGLRWDAGLQAWVGTVRGSVAFPSGCYETTHGEAAVASMGHADSAY